MTISITAGTLNIGRANPFNSAAPAFKAASVTVNDTTYAVSDGLPTGYTSETTMSRIFRTSASAQTTAYREVTSEIDRGQSDLSSASTGLTQIKNKLSSMLDAANDAADRGATVATRQSSLDTLNQLAGEIQAISSNTTGLSQSALLAGGEETYTLGRAPNGTDLRKSISYGNFQPDSADGLNFRGSVTEAVFDQGYSSRVAGMSLSGGSTSLAEGEYKLRLTYEEGDGSKVRADILDSDNTILATQRNINIDSSATEQVNVDFGNGMAFSLNRFDGLEDPTIDRLDTEESIASGTREEISFSVQSQTEERLLTSTGASLTSGSSAADFQQFAQDLQGAINQVSGAQSNLEDELSSLDSLEEGVAETLSLAGSSLATTEALSGLKAGAALLGDNLANSYNYGVLGGSGRDVNLDNTVLNAQFLQVVV